MASNDSRAAHYIARAKVIRENADKVKDPTSKEHLLEVARQYEALAARIGDGKP